MFYYAINKASNSLKLPPVKKIRLNQVCHLYFYENLLNFHKNRVLRSIEKVSI